MISKYIITNPYGEGNSKNNEVQIESDGLIYSEIGDSFCGCQVLNQDNHDIIEYKCIQIADLIREIDALNKAKEVDNGKG